MRKTIMLALNKFSNKGTPVPLLGAGGVPLDKLTVGIRKLCHHMLQDTFGLRIPNPNPLFLLYQQFITGSPTLEFRAGALGSHKESKIAESMKVGKAFCRWFLAEHFGTIYFGHMDHLLGKGPLPKFGNVQIVRSKKGETPDYLCADNTNIYLAEAKGRQDSHFSFKTKNFATWRKQFDKVDVLSPNGQKRKTKGYIVATRLKMDNQAKAVSKIYAEDPETAGETALADPEEISALRRMAIHDHYSTIFEMLGHPLHAIALRDSFLLPAGDLVVVGIWRCMIPQLANYRFVGGFVASERTEPIMTFPWWLNSLDETLWMPPDLRRFIRLPGFGWDPVLRTSESSFFGLEIQTFKGILQETRETDVAAPIFHDFAPASQQLPDQVSVLRDGTLLAPSSFMRLEDVVAL